ncbi:MAG: 2'-5' RNA ligase family protein [Candidatus Aenigmarchaeota archaeon]|nr:2'-5' RNA ligase family protein [Candidatus Aenigmarchaeota archaeon]
MGIMKRINQETLFERNWNRFKGFASENKVEKISESVFSRKDNPPYLAIQIDVNQKLWKPIQQIQADLETIEHRHKFYHPLYFHITVKHIGWDNGYDRERIKESVLTSLEKFEPFNINLKGLNIFPACVFVQVFNKNGSIHKIHESLCGGLRKFCDMQIIEGSNYIPHVAILSFDSDTNQIFLEAIEKYRCYEIGEFFVRRVHMVEAFSFRNVGCYKKIFSVDLKGKI